MDNYIAKGQLCTWLCTIAAVVTVNLALVACVSGDDFDVSPAPTLGAPVKAQFTISIPRTTGTSTRMSDDVVQTSASADLPKFRGINHINLFPFATTSYGVTDASILADRISLNQMIIPANTIDNYIPQGNLISTTNNAVLFGDVQIPLNTQSFLFYGKAIDESATESALTTADKKFKYGTLSVPAFTNGAALSTLLFQPEGIVSSADEGSDKRTAIATYLNAIACAKYTDESDVEHTWADESVNVGLQSLYQSFTGMKAGSSKDVEAAIEDLYNAVVSNPHPIAQAVKKAIDETKYDETNKYVAVTGSAAPYTVTFSEKISGYPGDINLPDGAAALEFASNAFTYSTAQSSTTSLNVGPITNFVYPPNLYYWVKSDLMVSSTSQQEHYTTDMTWNNAETTGIFNRYTNGTKVTATTRSILMTAPVQYAVGRLDVRIAASGTTLEDNPVNTEEKQNVDISKLEITGILIGGQKSVDWKFEPASSSGEYTIYDNLLKSQSATSKALTDKAFAEAETLASRTLVLETAGGDDEKVNVAVEFVNNGSDFMGKDHQVVPKGCKFYLVGALDMSKIGEENRKTGNKVFKQDYVTTVQFTVSDLKQAENVIPDLRNPAIELGLSVNLDWQEGITFVHKFGGD